MHSIVQINIQLRHESFLPYLHFLRVIGLEVLTCRTRAIYLGEIKNVSESDNAQGLQKRSISMSFDNKISLFLNLLIESRFASTYTEIHH